MSKDLYFKVKPGDKVSLSDYDAGYDAGMDKADVAKAEKPLLMELAELQQLMYGAGTHSLLIILQGRDTAGKDGAVAHVLDAVNPMGLKITSFKVPTEEEAAHDFLWRVHNAAPGKGVIGVFNRSHYEQVLVVRVDELEPEETWRKDYDLINDFEHLLVTTNTIVVKVYLHISKKEQARRLIDRQKDVNKSWKLSPGDWEVRGKWDAYTAAYEDALSKCSTDDVPWYVVPADKKWFRNLSLARLLVEYMRPYREDWEKKLAAIQADRLPGVRDAQKAEGE